MDELEQLLQYADPATIKQLVDSGLVPARMGVAQQGMPMAQYEGTIEQPQGRNVGNTYVASSPLEHLASAVRRVQGQRQAQSIIGQQGQMLDQAGQGKTMGWQQIVNAIRNRGQTPSAQSPQPMAPDGIPYG